MCLPPSVKRLQDKTQVFPLEPHDAVRTRLTHSLEVSSVARGLAARIAKWLKTDDVKEIREDMDRSIEAIAATCGLIHDLGNPPFGHAGEDAIRSWFAQPDRTRLLKRSLHDDQQIHDFLQFEGNAQSLRLVAKLQILADYNGLDLTFGTLSALMKYVAPSHRAIKSHRNHAFRKPGYFASEVDIVDDIRTATGTGEARHPICFVVEAADDISYLATDIEDAVKKRVLPWSKVHERLPTEEDSVKRTLKLMDKILESRPSILSGDLDDDIDDITATAFRTAAIAEMAARAYEVFKDRYGDIMEGRYSGSLLDDSNAAALVKSLREIGQTLVYPTHPTLKLELMGYKVIWDLMDLFWEGAHSLSPPKYLKSQFARKAAKLFSSNYLKVYHHSVSKGGRLPVEYFQFQLVTDYVCGMTDSFATNLHSDLFGGR